MKFNIKNYPIAATILILILAIILSQIVTQLIGRMEYALVLCALMTVGMAFLFRMPNEMLITSKLNIKSLTLYWVPLVYLATMPLLTGGYNFSLLTKETFIMMSGVGIFEEVLTHGVCMGLLLKSGDIRKEI